MTEAIALLEAEAHGSTLAAASLGQRGYAYYLDGHLELAQAALERRLLGAL